MTFCATTRRAW